MTLRNRRTVNRPPRALLPLGLLAALGAAPGAATPHAATPHAATPPAPPAHAAQGSPRAGTQPVDGQRVFTATCAACHQASGEGVPERYPPLAGSEWVTGDPARLVRLVLHGLSGEVEVQGETYTGAMPGWAATLNDADLAAVLTYVRGKFGNTAAPISAATVAQLRAATKARTAPWTAAELQAASRQ